MVRLTAEELGVRPEHYTALLWVRDALDPAIDDASLPDWMVFDMSTWIDSFLMRGDVEIYGEVKGLLSERIRRDWNCGTAACIGGSMQLFLSGAADSSEKISTDPTDPITAELCTPCSADQVGDGSTEWMPEKVRPFRALFYRYPTTKALDRSAAVDAIDEFLSGNVRDPWYSGGVAG